LVLSKDLKSNTNLVEVFKWHTKAAEKGNIDSYITLGVMYEEGKGVNQDYAKALNWYHKAADQNHPEAQFKLGVMYANGLGVEKNVDQALSWLNAQRLSKAMLMLRVFMTLCLLAQMV
jgi:TPR repeat protein